MSPAQFSPLCSQDSATRIFFLDCDGDHDENSSVASPWPPQVLATGGSFPLLSGSVQPRAPGTYCGPIRDTSLHLSFLLRPFTCYLEVFSDLVTDMPSIAPSSLFSRCFLCTSFSTLWGSTIYHMAPPLLDCAFLAPMGQSFCFGDLNIPWAPARFQMKPCEGFSVDSAG